MKRLTFPVARTARVEIRGNLSLCTEFVWIVLHGYAQPANDFVDVFSDLFGKARCFLAPEGLSKFYVKGASGNVGASWMTKQDREDEIQDYLAYLSKVMEYVHDLSPKAVVFLLGFSQGAATAARFFMSRNPQDIHALVLWAAVFPPDFKLPKHNQNAASQIHLVYGTSDPYMPKLASGEFSEYSPTFWPFDGGHELPPAVLSRVLQTLEKNETKTPV